MKIHGTSERPRLIIRRSLNNLLAQVIDDANNKVMLSASTFDKKTKSSFTSKGNLKAAKLLGDIFSKQLKEKNINKIVFDRAGYLYHGRVKEFAEALRKGGVEF